MSEPHVFDDGSDAQRLVVQPDASILDAIGRAHSPASALADLIDNSIDAGASRVSIQFVTKDSAITSIRIRDDGCGMTEAQLADAMALGKRKEPGERTLGHFGVGLKGASLSQAQVLTVVSSSGYAPPAAMRLGKRQQGSSIVADVIDSDIAGEILRRRGLGGETGTLVEWTHLESVSVASSVQDRRRWFESTILQIRDELGLTFHRILAAGRIRIELEELDEATSATGASRVVKPIDPFGFERWGAGGYPKELRGVLPSGAGLTATCFILPPGVESSLLGRSRRERQGLYVYRNDRLLQAGGWLGLSHGLPAELQLARMSLDVTDEALDVVVMNPEKRGVMLRPAAMQALGHAVDAGFTLRMFWNESQEVLTESKRRDVRAKPVAPLGDGAPAGLDDIMKRTVGVRGDGSVSLSFDWVLLPHEQLFAFEPPTGIVQLNQEHRELLEQSATTLPSLKTSLYLLLGPHVGKPWLGIATVELIDAMQVALAASVIPPRAEPPPAGHGLGLPELGVGERVPSAVVRKADPDEPLGDPRVAHVHVSEDALDDFMRRIRKKPLLTAEEEVELAHAIEVGLFAEERLASQLGASEHDQRSLDLARLKSAGDIAMARMIESNVRLVISIAKRYRGNGLDLEDLLQEGNAGLIRAVHKFDYRQGTKFSTYASWWIRQSITRAIADQGRLIRFPVHVVDDLPEIRRAWDDAPGCATQRIHAVADARQQSPGLIRGIINNLVPPLSLDSSVPIRSDGGAWVPVTLADALVDADAVDAVEHVAFLMLQRQLDQLFGALSEREAAVIRMRFGFGDGVQRTLDEIGETFGVTRERIRQVEKQTLEKLRSPGWSQSLRDYLGDCMRACVALEPWVRKDSSGRATTVPPESEADAVPRPRSYAVGAHSTPGTSPVAELETARSANAELVTAYEAAPVGDHEHRMALGPPAPISEDWDALMSMITRYSKGESIAEIAASRGVRGRDVAWTLAVCFFGLKVGADDPATAVNHGAPYTPAEAAHIDEMAALGWPVEAIAAGRGRTPFAVAWRILDGRSRPRVTRKMIAALRQNMSG